MNSPLQVTFRDLKPDAAVDEAIVKKVKKLEQLCDRITSVEVHISLPHRHHHKGRLFQVDVVIGVPGGPLAFTRHPAEHHAHEKVLAAVADAFRAARRGLREHMKHKHSFLRPIAAA